MNPLAFLTANPLAILVAIIALGGAVGGVYIKGRVDGDDIATARCDKRIAVQRAEIERKNKVIVSGDQELVVAKAQDKEKIVTIYRTIREQMDAQIITNTVYRDTACNVPADGLRLIAIAASGGLSTNPGNATRDPASTTPGPGK